MVNPPLFLSNLFIFCLKTTKLVLQIQHRVIRDAGGTTEAVYLGAPSSAARGNVKLRLKILMHSALQNKDADKTHQLCAHARRQLFQRRQTGVGVLPL